MISDSPFPTCPSWDDSQDDSPAADGTVPRPGHFQQSFQDQLIGLVCIWPDIRPACFSNGFKAEVLQVLAWAVSATLLARLRRHFRSAESRTEFLLAHGLDPHGPVRKQLPQILRGDRRVALARLDLLEKLLAAAGHSENPVFLKWLLQMALGQVRPTGNLGIRSFTIDYEDLHLIVAVYAYGLGDFYADIVYPFQAYDLYSRHVPVLALQYCRYFDTYADVARVEFTPHGREKLMSLVKDAVQHWRLTPAADPKQAAAPGEST